MLAALYIRATELGPDVTDQRRAIVQCITTNGWDFGGGEYLDVEGFDGRPGAAWTDFLRRMKTGRFAVAVAFSAERMFRNLQTMQRVLDLMARSECRLHLCHESMTIEPSGATARAMSLIGKLEHARRSEQLRIAFRGHTPPGRPKATDEAMDEQIHTMLDAGKTAVQISKALNIGRHIVRRRIEWRQRAQPQGVQPECSSSPSTLPA